MPLQSELFRSDPSLEACLVDDRAHVVKGSRGPHVGKLQRALAVLDGALIALDEISSQRYGTSTATAVLNYKRVRKIINLSYQTTADNIVLLLPFKFTLRTQFIGSFPFPLAIGERDAGDVEGLRKAAEKANAGSESTLRVIFCKFRPTTSTGTSNGRITGIEGFRNFVLLNKEKLHPDFGTLLHEMIHCSNDNLMSDLAHDSDSNSIFSFGQKRTLVTNGHATSLRKSFFA